MIGVAGMIGMTGVVGMVGMVVVVGVVVTGVIGMVGVAGMVGICYNLLEYVALCLTKFTGRCNSQGNCTYMLVSKNCFNYQFSSLSYSK